MRLQDLITEAPPASNATLALAIFAAVGVAAVIGTILLAVCILVTKTEGGAR